MELAKREDIVAKSTEIVDKLLEGTQFENDPESTEILSGVKRDFEAILATDTGESLMSNVGKLGKKVTTEAKFFDTAKVIFRLVKQLSSSPIVKFGLFLLGIGALIAVVGSFAFVAEAALAVWILRLLMWIGGALMSLSLSAIFGGAVKSLKKFEAFWATPALPEPPKKNEDFVLIDLETPANTK